MNNPTPSKRMWTQPWGYNEPLAIGFGLILTGFMLEVSQAKIVNLMFPYNVIFLSAFIGLLFALYLWFGKTVAVRWLLKVPSSICSIVLLTALVMVMGIVPQEVSNNEIINLLGLNRILNHWSFLLTLLYFLTCLGLVTIKRILVFKWSDFGFVLNHLGLFIVLTAGVLGTGDLQRLTINLYENKANLWATDVHNKKIELPFAFYLKDFKMEEYPPKIAMVDNKSGKIVINDGKNMFLIEADKKYNFESYEVKIEQYFPSSVKVGADKYVPVNEQGSVPSAKIKVTDFKNGVVKTAWISCGSFRFPFEGLKIDENFSMVMTIPEPKKFSSDLDILTQEGERFPVRLEVNKPFEYDGWEIYQLSYDEKMGKSSDMSVIELVRDPWLPVIYFGIFMMIFGAVYMFWIGNKIKSTDSLGEINLKL